MTFPLQRSTQSSLFLNQAAHVESVAQRMSRDVSRPHIEDLSDEPRVEIVRERFRRQPTLSLTPARDPSKYLRAKVRVERSRSVLEYCLLCPAALWITLFASQLQVVDFNEKTHDRGVYKLLDFADGRHVATVRILAKSESDDTKLAVYLSK